MSKHKHLWRQEQRGELLRCEAASCGVYGTMKWVDNPNGGEELQVRHVNVMSCAANGCKEPATVKRKDGSVVCKVHPE